MNVLCIETSAAYGSVALACGGDVIDSVIDTPRAQSEELIGRIDELLARTGIGLQQLDAVGFGCGPGSYIGVRLGSAVAQGLAVAAGIGIVPVSSMMTLAAQAAAGAGPDDTHVMICLDARMGEVYVAEYRLQSGALQGGGAERLLKPADVAWPATGTWLAAGSGFTAHAELQTRAVAHGMRFVGAFEPRARDALAFARAAAERGESLAPWDWQGRYLRDATAWQTM